MPSIRYAHVCEYARIDQSGTVSIIGIFDTIHVAGVPVNFPFLHVITSLGGQQGEQFQFFTRISAPDGKVLQSAPQVEIAIHQEDSSANQINGYLGMIFPVFGVYSVEFLIDEMTVHTIPFRVMQRPHR
jgi:hypothetical protein